MIRFKVDMVLKEASIPQCPRHCTSQINKVGPLLLSQQQGVFLCAGNRGVRNRRQPRARPAGLCSLTRSGPNVAALLRTTLLITAGRWVLNNSHPVQCPYPPSTSADASFDGSRGYAGSAALSPAVAWSVAMLGHPCDLDPYPVTRLLSFGVDC